MKRKYSTEELVKLFDDKDWPALWKIVTPMVKHAVRRCMQEGLDPYYVRDDLMQEAYLAAWEALPRWDPNKAQLQTWIDRKVRGAAINAKHRESFGMIGGRDSGSLVVSMHGVVADDEDENAGPLAPEASLVYEDPPEGFGDPSEEAEDLVEAFIRAAPAGDQDMLRRLCGAGVPQETQAEYADKEDIHRNTVVNRLTQIRQKLCAKTSEPVKYVLTHAEFLKQRSAA